MFKIKIIANYDKENHRELHAKNLELNKIITSLLCVTTVLQTTLSNANKH